MRPLMTADPMLRAPSPEIVSASATIGPDHAREPGGWAGAVGAACGAGEDAWRAVGAGDVAGAGGPWLRENFWSSTGGLPSIVSNVIFVFSGLPFTANSSANGRY